MKWRVTFEVDLGDSIPAEEDLKPHDHPLESWAGQTVHDLILNKALVAILSNSCSAATEKDPVIRDALLASYDKHAKIATEARDSMQIERLLD